MDDENTSRLEFVTARTRESRDYFRKMRDRNQLKASLFVGAAASLSAVATVGLGASKMTGAAWLEVVALVASGLATIIGALEALLVHRRLWHINITAQAALGALLLDINYRETDPQPLTTEEVDKFYERYKKIYMDTDQAWIESYSPK